MKKNIILHFVNSLNFSLILLGFMFLFSSCGGASSIFYGAEGTYSSSIAEKRVQKKANKKEHDKQLKQLIQDEEYKKAFFEIVKTYGKDKKVYLQYEKNIFNKFETEKFEVLANNFNVFGLPFATFTPGSFINSNLINPFTLPLFESTLFNYTDNNLLSTFSISSIYNSSLFYSNNYNPNFIFPFINDTFSYSNLFPFNRYDYYASLGDPLFLYGPQALLSPGVFPSWNDFLHNTKPRNPSIPENITNNNANQDSSNRQDSKTTRSRLSSQQITGTDFRNSLNLASSIRVPNLSNRGRIRITTNRVINNNDSNNRNASSNTHTSNSYRGDNSYNNTSSSAGSSSSSYSSGRSGGGSSSSSSRSSSSGSGRASRSKN